MCSGGAGSQTGPRAEAARLANISKIKSQQAARKGNINVVMGGGVEDYRRSLATGAKNVGMTKEDLENLKMSNLFTANMGQAEWEDYLASTNINWEGSGSGSGGESEVEGMSGGGPTGGN